VPPGHTATVIAHFSAESTCYGGQTGSFCAVILVMGTTEMQPS